jgi:UPF0755 protein
VGIDSNLELKVIKGQGIKEIAAALSQARLIKSVTVFKFYIILSGEAQHLKPGTYQFNGQMSVPEMVDFLIKGVNEETTVTIPEGTTVKEIDQILSSAGVITSGTLAEFDFSADFSAEGGSASGGQFLKGVDPAPFLDMNLAFADSFREAIQKRCGVDNLEGFLYPDTYRFKINSSVEEITKKLVGNFQEKIWPLISQKDNWYEILILASILEKEVLTFEDRQLVAGILNKRLAADIPLQVDATIAYVKCQGNLRSCPQRQVLKTDLKIDSPYNTYLNRGWPPTPIANTNETTIQAALNPKPSSYWYYLSAEQTKETIFAKTLDEHNKNRQQYLPIR